MNYISKLFRNVHPSISNICRSQGGGSIKDAGGKWAERLEAKEGEYFWKKNQEYLDYIREEMDKGRTLNELIDEHKHNLQELKRRKEMHEEEDHSVGKWAEAIHDDDHSRYKQPHQYSESFRTSDTDYVEYIWREVKKGRPLEEVIKETLGKLEQDRDD